MQYQGFKMIPFDAVVRIKKVPILQKHVVI